MSCEYHSKDVSIEADGWVRAIGPNGALLVRVLAGVPHDLRLSDGDDAPGGGWVSPAYGRRVPAPQLVVSGRSTLPRRVVTILFPVANPGAAPPELEPLLDSDFSLEGS